MNTVHDAPRPVVHWMPPRSLDPKAVKARVSAKHAARAYPRDDWSENPADVTCTVCRAHLPTPPAPEAPGVVQG